MVKKEQSKQVKLSIKRKNWVNKEVRKRTRGKTGINPSTLYGPLWEEARAKYPE